MDLRFCYYFLNIIIIVYCSYPPTGDEVQAGSVLLPASRRGRYLANIVRRQAVDGTGIKFNKDADRMNAEAKKKVDVLSDELLPYIIAEQERRITLYKRVITAIQNGEKGVTVAELRKKPPLIIRKGLMYRCPSNRAPKEPDGTGTIMCEEGIEPTPVMYDSCLSAEDKELYVAENKYFFCNRHRVEGPDLPRNGSAVIACAPLERTSLNYTTSKCALEDTDDVVVHYRYYPDRTYKFVTELDPDREVCDHWDPCQIGYIYSLPSPDQAVQANELWQDEIVPEDIIDEFVYPGMEYETNLRKIKIPPGYEYHGVGRWDKQTNARVRLTAGPFDYVVASGVKNLKVSHRVSGKWLKISMKFSPFTSEDATSYYVRFGNHRNKQYSYRENVLVLHETTTQLKPKKIDQLVPGQRVDKTAIALKCNRCTLLNVVKRNLDGSVVNVDTSKYSIKNYTDQKQYIELDLEETSPEEFGDYYAIIQNEDGSEETLKLFSLNDLTVQRLKAAIEPGTNFDGTVKYQCANCELMDVVCNGESVMTTGRVSIVPSTKQVNFNFPSFQDEYSGVYIGVFKEGGKYRTKKLSLLENSYVKLPNNMPVSVIAPEEGEPFQQLIYLTCEGNCTVEKFIPGLIAAGKALAVAAKGVIVGAKIIGGSKIVQAAVLGTAGGVADAVVSKALKSISYPITISAPNTGELIAGDYIAKIDTNEGSVSKKILEVCSPEAECEDLVESPSSDESATESPTATDRPVPVRQSTEAEVESTTSAVKEATNKTTEVETDSTTSETEVETDSTTSEKADSEPTTATAEAGGKTKGD